MGWLGFEHSSKNRIIKSKTKIVKSSDAKSDAHGAPTPAFDPDLAEIVQCWPKLPDAIRSAIVAIVRSSNER
jgi:hypothetical protein